MSRHVVAALMLVFYPVLLLASRKCVPTDWTQNANYLDWGSCNWPNMDTPCGRIVEVPGKPPGQRAWPYGTCTLKFTRTPWAPSVYPQEKENTWICGTRFMVCRRPAENGRNGSQEVLECGGKVAGTERPCPNDLSGWTCNTTAKEYPDSNCKSDGDDLVLDVSTMGYPESVLVTRVATSKQCGEMCDFKPGCNLYVFCNSPNGCGFSCQELYKKIHDKKKKTLPLAAIIGITAGAVLLICIVAVAIVWFVCCRSRPSKQMPTHQIPMSTPTAQAKLPETPPLKTETSHPHSTASSPPIPAGFPTTTVGYPMETSMENPNRLSTMASVGGASTGMAAGSPGHMGPTYGGSTGTGGTPSPAARAPRRFLFTGSSESGSEASSSIYPVQYSQGGGWPQSPPGPHGLPPRQQRGANHAVL